VFRSWVTGQYYKPRETELVIMFLDMKDSTVLAERLGNLRFSALVRDFFNDLTEPLEATGGEVSHYIGDEAVIYWRPRAVVQSLSLPARFAEELEHRREHYVREYGIVPAFKAGVHLGPVVATEVGQIKSEIVFHGDVLNTAARIQGLCNELGEQLLASVDVVHKAGHGIQLESLGLHRLKGKEEELELFRLSPAAQN
jgi:adenylate cyclase